MQVRELRAGEVRRLVAELWLPFVREVAGATPQHALADDAAAVREQAIEHRRERLDDPETVTCVVVDDGDFVGFAEAERRRSPGAERPRSPVAEHHETPGTERHETAGAERGEDCHVRGVYVRPARRGEGLADALLARVEAWGRQRGCQHATVDVQPDNDAAKALYSDRGYELSGSKLALGL